MKITIRIILLTLLTTGSLAYADDDAAIAICLSEWDSHPFTSKPTYRVIAPKVTVFGIGKRVNENKTTPGPELVLVKPNVSVMSKNTIVLGNPNGWYCMHNRVNVMSKSIIKLHCTAHIASTSEDVSVLAGGEDDQGVTVMGKAVIERTGCQ